MLCSNSQKDSTDGINGVFPIISRFTKLFGTLFGVTRHTFFFLPLKIFSTRRALAQSVPVFGRKSPRGQTRGRDKRTSEDPRFVDLFWICDVDMFGSVLWLSKQLFLFPM